MSFDSHVQNDLYGPASLFVPQTFDNPDSQKQATWGHISSIIYLLHLRQNLGQHADDVAGLLRQKVAEITQGKAQLVLRGRGNESSISPSTYQALLGFSVQYGEVSYGELYIALDDEQPGNPALPFEFAQLLAHVCGLILYTLEQFLFFQAQYQRIDSQIDGSLTRREKEVFALMFLGYSQQDIAEKLSISLTTVGKHRQHIYDKLGTHCEIDALLAGYQCGLFSIVDLFDIEI